MNKLFKVFLILILSAVGLFAQTERKSLSVTVYNNDLGVVNETRSIDLKSGINEIRIVDVAEKIDPTSVHIKLNGTVLEQNYQYDLVSFYKILQKYLDNKIRLIAKDGKLIEGTLLSVSNNQIVLNMSDGGLLMLPKIEDYQIAVGSLPSGLITKPALVWLVDAKKSGNQNSEISYQTQGMNWHTEYVAMLNENDTKADLNAWVSISNFSGASFPDAKIKLVAGNVNMVQNDDIEMGNVRMMMMDKSERSDQFKEKSFFEYHMYDLQRPSTIANNEVKQVSLFEAADISIKKKYLLKLGNNPVENKKVPVVVEFENKEKNHLGIPMPKGKVRLYKADGGSAEFIGEDLLDHTPKDEKIKLKVGEAFDVLVDQKYADQKRISDKVHDNEFNINIRNRKDEDIEVEIDRYLGESWEILKSSQKWEKKDANTITFKVKLKAGSESDINLKIRYTY